jgi:oligoendopeptidase F
MIDRKIRVGQGTTIVEVFMRQGTIRKTMTGILMLMLLGTAALYAQGQRAGVRQRSEIDIKYTWNLSDIYSSREAWEKDFARLDKELLPKVKKFQGKLKDAATILACLRASDECSRVSEKLYVYAGLYSDEDLSDGPRSELRSRIESLTSNVSVAQAYISPELLMLSEKTLHTFEKSPAFREYAHKIDALIRKKAHTLPREQEELLSGASETANAMQSIFGKLTYADITFPVIKDPQGKDVQISESVYQQILKDSNRDFRKRAFEARYLFFEGHKNTYAELINYEVRKNVFYAKAYKYSSALQSTLSEEFIPEKVYDNLVMSVDNRLSYLHRYMTLRKRVMGLDSVHLYDMYVPLVAEIQKPVSFDEAHKMIIDGLAPLGKEYLTMLETGFSNRWIDVYPTKGKKDGGYCWGSYDTHPFILLNYNDTDEEMMTIAHEMGHAMHNYYSAKTQPYSNADPVIFTAEVASTANEIIMHKYMIRTARNDDERLYYIDQMLELIRGTVYTQVMYSEFEKLIHERVEKGAALSDTSLRDIWRSLMKKYFGPDFALDEQGTMWWARIGHFYRSFYVYKYATSISAANQLVKNMNEGKNPDAQKKYLAFLKSGGSDYPIELLRKAGVDMTTPAPVDSILNDFNAYIDEMEGILKKQGRIK